MAAAGAGAGRGFANPPVWNGTTVLDRYTFPTPIPTLRDRRRAKALNAEHTETRVLAIPGQNDAAYRYGNTIDPIWPGLLTRPFVTRQQLALGSLPSYDMTYALDVPMQNRTADPAAIAPMARLMSVGDVLVQNDLAYELYDRPRPQQFWQSLAPAARPGCRPRSATGRPPPNVLAHPHGRRVHAGGAPRRAVARAPRGAGGGRTPGPIARAESTSGALRRGGRRRGAQRRRRARPPRHRPRPSSTPAPSTATPAPCRARCRAGRRWW